ncbi:LysE family translocator [Phenylobacterium sp.]|jgi:threonine/homoserine/homoserine lactone efflux protein|uniref:LysE family translocator n=1 Tax=Phenylobacterium sp. TaxID=1871053 RepID=UPI0035AEEC16
MPSPEMLIAFVGASLVLAFIPGPDNIFVLTQAAMRGWKVGVSVTLGLCTGLLVHTALVAFGLAVIFQKSALAFTLLKFAGAAYLLYLAWGAFRAGPASIEGEALKPQPFWRLYLRGIVMNVTNPKVAIFFLAFLPQFITPAAGPFAPQVAVLGVVFIACSLFAFSLISVMAGVISARLMRSEKAQITMNRVASLIFVGLAAKLATAQS